MTDQPVPGKRLAPGLPCCSEGSSRLQVPECPLARSSALGAPGWLFPGDIGQCLAISNCHHCSDGVTPGVKRPEMPLTTRDSTLPPQLPQQRLNVAKMSTVLGEWEGLGLVGISGRKPEVERLPCLSACPGQLTLLPGPQLSHPHGDRSSMCPRPQARLWRGLGPDTRGSTLPLGEVWVPHWPERRVGPGPRASPLQAPPPSLWLVRLVALMWWAFRRAQVDCDGPEARLPV